MNKNADVMSLTDTLDRIVSEVEKKIDYHFSGEEVSEVLAHTIRKCEINGKGNDYIPILFENELRDYVSGMLINALGYRNYLRKKTNQEVPANV